MFKKALTIIITLLIFSFSVVLMGNEPAKNYFPGTLGSYWVYEDQDGNEMTRRAIEGEEITGQTFAAFSYEPELEDWTEYSPFISPSLYNVSNAGITLVVGDEVEKAVKARLSKEMESLREIIRRDDPDAANFTYNIEVEAQDNSHLLLMPITPNEEWDTNEIKASLALIFEGEEQVKIDYTIMETGIVKGTETVVAAAGTFEDCLKVEYRTETTAVLDPAELPDEMDPPGEIVTTVWFAPDVGIVKFHQKMNYMFFDMFQDEFQDDGGLEKPPDPEPKTFELKKYEIKTAEPEIKTAVPDSDDSDDSNLGNESDSKYFPDTLESYWIYEDQDGNEFTRHAIEREEIAGKTFSAFSYEPELEDWTEYNPFIYPSLYQVSDAGITLIVGDEVEKGLKTRLKKEMDAFVEAIMATGAPPDVRINVDIDVQVQDLLFLLPDAIIADEEWDANQIEAKVKMTFIGDSVPDDYKLTIDFTIIETGIVLGTDSVETAAGTFEDCLKVEYRTETKAILDPVPRPDEVAPPGETVTTLWFAPNVGIVKFHQKMNYMFFGMFQDDDGLPKPPDPEPKTFELKKYEIKTAEPEIKTAVPDSDESDDSNLGNESDPKYFPDTLASYWVYEDQDGNELTRRAIEGEEIAGKTFPAFSYEPELKDWAEYSPFISPSLYNVSDAGITLVVGDEVEKAVKARLSEEMESFREIIRRDDPDAANFTYNIEVEAQDSSNLLPTPVIPNEKWDTNEIKASLALIFEGEEQVKIDYTIMETGIVKGTETVVAAAGTFEDCLKVEYRTETTAVLDPAERPDEMDPPGEIVTTVWFAPDVGIVKFHQKMNYMFFDMFQDEFLLLKPPDPEPKTFELKKFEIKTADSEIKTAVPDSDDGDVNNLGNESDSKYFPDTLESYWVYEDQDGNELTRRAIEGEEIAGQTFAAFSYEPELEDWTEYSPFISPSLYKVSDAGITLVVGDEVEKALKARLRKEFDTFIDVMIGQQKQQGVDPNELGVDIKIEVQGQDLLFLLSDGIDVNEEWDVNQIEAKVKLIPRGAGLGGGEQITLDYTITETGIVLGTESIKTDAGTFEDCLKVEYRTETTGVINPSEKVDPPGETVTTIWYAPNVGIVKYHQKSGYIFLDMIPDYVDLPIVKLPNTEKTLELKKYEIKTTEPEIKTAIPDSDDSNLGNESDSKYFPDTLASYWVYEDQDGNELTRRAIEGEEIAGQTFPAFSYEPELKDWAEYSPFISPSLYNVSDAGITLVVGDEVEKAVKARLSKEMESVREIFTIQQPDDADFNYEIKAEAHKHSYLLPTPIVLNEEWDVNQIKASLALDLQGHDQVKIDFTIVETGIVLGTESVETAAGTFEGCLKVEYRTETTAIMTPIPSPDEVDPPGETVTTVWFAPNVGIVKFHQKRNYMFFDMFPDDDELPKPPDPEPKTFELKRYEIRTADSENEESN